MLLLMCLFVIPFLCSAVLFCIPMIGGKNLKRLAIGLSIIPLLILIYNHSHWIGSHIEYSWLPALAIQFHLSVDSLSLLFLYLTAVIIPISLCSAPSRQWASPHLFYGIVLLLQGLLIAFFTARDLAVFAFFWEAMLLPLYLIIAHWGTGERQKAALKFIIYMFAGSVLMVAAVLFLYLASSSAGAGTFNLDSLAKVASTAPHAKWIFGIFLLAFAVKTPLFPFHAWLPDAYCQAPTSGTILLSALLSKAGIYGIVRIGLELFPNFMREGSVWLLGLAIIGVLYGGLAAWRQVDYKRLIAYASFSHVNFVLAGLFVWSQSAHGGGILQAFNHGITIAALFLVAGWLEERLGSTAINAGSGICSYLPQLCWLTLFFVLASVSLPGTNNFIGELMILFGIFPQHPWLAAVLGLTVILSVIYMLRWMQKIYFGAPSGLNSGVQDIGFRHLFISAPLIFLILWIGIYPSPVLDMVRPVVEKIASIAKTEQIK